MSGTQLARRLVDRLRGRRPARSLVAVPTIDRDVPLAPMCFAALRPVLIGGADLMVLARESDMRARSAWPALWAQTILEVVPDYPIEGRHNYDALAETRNRARRFAMERGYGALLFVDADVEIGPNTFDRLTRCLCDGADVAFAAYGVRWCGDQPIIGVRDAASGAITIERVPDTGGAVCGRPVIGGLGCTLIHRRALEVPIAARSLTGPGGFPVVGEDIGFYLACIEQGKRICYLREVVRHHPTPGSDG